MRTKYCPCHKQYEEYYTHGGSGFLPVFQGRLQHGSGIGGLFASLISRVALPAAARLTSKSIMPMVKSIGKPLLKKGASSLLNTSGKLVAELAKGKNLKQVVRQQAPVLGKRLAEAVQDELVKPRKVRRASRKIVRKKTKRKNNRKTKKQPRDIFQ